MAANYWASTQRRHWQFTKDALLDIRQKLEDEDRALVQQYPLPDRRVQSHFFNQQLVKLGRRMTIRQQALATAQVFIRRFYTKVEIRRTNPYLVMATALYLACKMEECPQHIRVVVSEARSIWSEFIVSDISKLGECEFFMISEMNSQLIVHHPYRSLVELQSTLNMAQEEVSLAWSIINDHYLTDLPLLYPPHVVAVTAIFLAMVLKPTQAGLHAASNAAATLSNVSQAIKGVEPSQLNDIGATTPQGKVQSLVKWLGESEIDIKAVVDCSQEIISLYDIWDQGNEKTCREQIARYVKARGLDK
ncbi:rna polymerase ii holoenzyme cyclin-like subunit [Lasallia pustulata]|uniref:RNA polymerase II holoenzyme cyclin-like subunit n=1 Tax=Lasallia pustulata TaxID=136370 RepID=A0A1W5DB91_9LECA|nr:rna polymerase ii holoenzyme cyclin-like subunit [Lasallia pustulata]